MKKLNWRPLKKGKIYCSTACGHGCTRVEFEIATAKAHLLTKQLGHRWSSRVWENLGWHYEAVSSCGQMVVFPTGGTFMARIANQFTGTGTSPMAAAQAAMKVLKMKANKLSLLAESVVL